MRNQRKRSRDETSQSPTASKPKAQKLLESLMQKLRSEVKELCGGEGDLSSSDEGSASEHQDAEELDGWFVEDLETTNCFVSSPTQAAGVSYLIQACKETGSTKQTYAPVSVQKPGMLSLRQVRMIEAIELKDLPGSVVLGEGYEAASTVVDFNAESFAETIKSFYGQINAENNEKADDMEKDAKNTPKSCLLLELPGDITGDDIEVYCGNTKSWKVANVLREEDGKIHVLAYQDGGVERIKLESRLWRPLR